MKYLLLCAALTAALFANDPIAQTETAPCSCVEEPSCGCEVPMPSEPRREAVLSPVSDLRINVVGQGVAPCEGACAPAQSYALAKRAAIVDSYRLLAEKIKGVRVEGQDYIKNMMVKRSTVRTYVDAVIRDAYIVETTFKEGLCEVEMEIVLSYAQFAH